MSYVNSSGYVFHPLSSSNLSAHRSAILLKQTQSSPALTGTILISPEGVNVRLSGSEEDVAEMKQCIINVMSALPPFAYKDTKTSQANLPRFLVKIKKHLIGFPVPMGERPVAKLLKASELDRMMAEGAVLLDTRNDYEFKLGKFKNAVTLAGLTKFQDYPSQVGEVSEQLPATKPVIMYCTGGIRCEKAQFAMPPGLDLYQLEGGVLSYFKEAEGRGGGGLWEGDLFVFDDRVAINSRGEKALTKSCFKCR